MAIHIGVDVGGTFTDVALFDANDERLIVHKTATTPSDPAQAIQAGVRWVLRQADADFSEIDHFVHGTTLVANAVIERCGPATGMLCTAGFASVLDIAREHRYEVYDLRIPFPRPLVPARLRREVSERILFDGQVERDLNADEVIEGVRDLVEGHQIRSLAVCFVNSFLYPRHEEQARDLISREFPGLYVSTSADVSPLIREYARWTTATINAYGQPLVDHYLNELQQWLREQGCRGEVCVISSDGSMLSLDTAKRYPVRLLESGAAAAMQMSVQLSELLDEAKVLALDMGGTTAKGGVLQNGALPKCDELEIGRIYKNRPGSGLPLQTRAVDLFEVGVGGGSIAKLDIRNMIQIGPNATGAAPGPACFGKGGKAPTVTDANLLLGYHGEESFLGGRMRLNRTHAEAALTRFVAEPAAIDLTRAAWGVHEGVNEMLVGAFRSHVAERGQDYRQATLLASGGAAPAHALRVARKLGIEKVVLPVAAGLMSAVGLLTAPKSFQLTRSYRVMLNGLSAQAFAGYFQSLERKAISLLVRDDEHLSPMTISRQLDMRYAGQGFEIEVALPDQLPDLPAAYPQLRVWFADRYRSIYQLEQPDRDIEIVNWKVRIEFGRALLASDILRAKLRVDPREISTRWRQAYFPEAGGFVECPVVSRYSLAAGDCLSGPALIEENESTSVVGVDDLVEVDRFGHLIATINGCGQNEQRH